MLVMPSRLGTIKILDSEIEFTATLYPSTLKQNFTKAKWGMVKFLKPS